MFVLPRDRQAPELKTMKDCASVFMHFLKSERVWVCVFTRFLS